MDKDKIFPSSKKINVPSTSSLVGLKAELFKRKAEIQTQKVESHEPSSSSSSNCNKKPKWQIIANQLEAKGELNKIKPVRRLPGKREEKKEVKEEKNLFEEEQLKKSRESLEAKAKLYEERYRKAYNSCKYSSSDSDCDTDGETLINFRQKVLVHKDASKYKDKESERSPSPVSTVPLSKDLDEDEDWVEFTDSLGRSRRCLKKDFEHFKQLDEEAKRDLTERQNRDRDSDDEGGNLLTADEKKKELEQKNWEEIRPLGPVRYREVIQDEVREHGVGFYMMSTDDEERKKQLDMLNSLHQQTAKQREMREKIKEKRKQAMKERLAKVAERKGIQLKVDSPDEEKNQRGEEDEEESIGPYPSLAHDSIAMTSRDREALAMKEIVTREWDSGKRDEAGRIVKSPPKCQRILLPVTSTDVSLDERNEEFAPPVSYLSDDEKDKFNCFQSTLKKKSSSSTLHSSTTQSIEEQSTDEFKQLISEKLAHFRNNKS